MCNGILRNVINSWQIQNTKFIFYEKISKNCNSIERNHCSQLCILFSSSNSSSNQSLKEAVVTAVISDNLVRISTDEGDANLVIDHQVGVGDIIEFMCPTDNCIFAPGMINRRVVVNPGGEEKNTLCCDREWKKRADGSCCVCSGFLVPCKK